METSGKNSINDVIDLYLRRQKRAKLTVKKIDRETILVEGNAAAFEFLSKILLAHAQAHDCGFELSPRNPGRAWFTKDAKLGFYFHRLPCVDTPSRSRKPRGRVKTEA